MSNPQQSAWNAEYNQPTFLSVASEPQKAVGKFVKWLERKQKLPFHQTTVLDVGCGNGRNSLYLAQKGAEVFGFDFSSTAVSQASDLAREAELAVDFRVHDLNELLPYADQQFSIVIDMVTSHALDPDAREQYLEELQRVCEPGAYIFLRTLTSTADKNYKELCRQYPGPIEGSYTLPQNGITEYPVSMEQIRSEFKDWCEVLEFKRTEGYTGFAGQPYKRCYCLGYFRVQ